MAAIEARVPPVGRSALGLAPWAWAAGALWACSSFLRGATALEYALLTAGASFTLWLALIAILEAERDPRLRNALLAAFGVATMALALAGRGLLASTHHRPLGAVTLALLGVGVTVALWFVFWRRQAGLVGGVVLSLIALSFVAWQVLDVQLLVVVEWAAGSLLLGAVLRLSKRVPPVPSGISALAAGLLVALALVAAFVLPTTAQFPWVMNVFGLLA